MSEDTAPGLDELRSITDHVRFILDAKQCLKRAEELISLTIAASEAQAALANAESEQAGRWAKREAGVVAREAEAEQKAAHASGLIVRAEQIEARLQRIARDIDQHDARLRREVMRFARLDINWNDKLQSMPSWSVLADEVLNGKVDANDIDGDQHSGRDAAAAAETALPPENLIAGSSLTRSGGHRNGAHRRAQP